MSPSRSFSLSLAFSLSLPPAIINSLCIHIHRSVLNIVAFVSSTSLILVRSLKVYFSVLQWDSTSPTFELHFSRTSFICPHQFLYSPKLKLSCLCFLVVCCWYKEKQFLHLSFSLATLLNLVIIKSNNLSINPFGFSVYMSSAEIDSFIYSFLVITPFFSLALFP